MRTYRTYLSAALLVGIVGCGSSSSDNGGLSSTGRDPANGGQCKGSSTGQTCTGEEAYTTCLTAACSTQIKACFGNGYSKGDFSGGACSEFITCEMACPCDATATSCVATCGQQFMMAGACSTCMATLTGCVQAAGCAAPVCTGAGTGTGASTSTGTGTATGASCSKLQTCCASIADSTVATQCNAAIAAGEVGCSMALQGFQAAGLCK